MFERHIIIHYSDRVFKLFHVFQELEYISQKYCINHLAYVEEEPYKQKNTHHGEN